MHRTRTPRHHQCPRTLRREHRGVVRRGRSLRRGRVRRLSEGPEVSGTSARCSTRWATEIDAVVVSTPDHNHFPATMAAMELGKHVFCEKPLTHTVWEARTMKKAARHHKVISQMGNQGHATEGIRYVKEWFDAGVLGNVSAGGGMARPDQLQRPVFQANPTHFRRPACRCRNISTGICGWVPVTEKTPYNPVYHPRTWRGFFRFGSGLLGDWACHTLDAPFWALGSACPRSSNWNTRPEARPISHRMPPPCGSNFPPAATSRPSSCAGMRGNRSRKSATRGA